MDELPNTPIWDNVPDEVKRLFVQLGQETEAQIDESEVERIYAEVFPIEFPGISVNAQKVLIRVALSNRIVAQRFGVPFPLAWTGLEITILNPASAGRLHDDYDRETWSAVCARLKKSVFGE